MYIIMYIITYIIMYQLIPFLTWAHPWQWAVDVPARGQIVISLFFSPSSPAPVLMDARTVITTMTCFGIHPITHWLLQCRAHWPSSLHLFSMYWTLQNGLSLVYQHVLMSPIPCGHYTVCWSPIRFATSFVWWCMPSTMGPVCLTSQTQPPEYGRFLSVIGCDLQRQVRTAYLTPEQNSERAFSVVRMECFASRDQKHHWSICVQVYFDSTLGTW